MNYKKFTLSLVLPQLAGIIGAFFTTSAIPIWYANLIKPSFTPPSWLFGPVWVMLYFLMGISIYLIWNEAPQNKKIIQLFWVQLVINMIWTPLFFGLRNPLLGLITIILLWILIVILIIKFWKINKTSSYLLIPYLIWVSYASALNFAIFYLNR